MSTQPHPYDRRHLKQVLHKNEMADKLIELRDWAMTHLEAVLIGALVLAAAVFGVVFFINGQKQKDQEASRLLNEAQDLFQQAGSLDPVSATQAYGQAYSKYQALVGSYGGSEQAQAARLGMANSDLAAGKVQDAEREYAALDVHDPKSAISALAALGTARALEFAGKASEAQKAYADALKNYPGSAIEPEAKAALERIAKNPALPVSASIAAAGSQTGVGPASAPLAPSAALAAPAAAPKPAAPQPVAPGPLPVPGR